ncbi:MAG: hypothetical protein PVJ73_19100 [Acidobacteriota bacterium]|jgi:Tol biopolymer transport system component
MPETNEDILLIPLDEPSETKVVLSTPFTEEAPAVSPDGRWMVYEANSTGRFEVYVRSVDGGSDQWRISTDGGLAGRWASGGREIVYASLDGKVMAVPTRLSPRFRPGTPTELFALPESPELYSPLLEDVSPDGKRLLLNLPTKSRSSLAFHLITNWPSLVSR